MSTDTARHKKPTDRSLPGLTEHSALESNPADLAPFPFLGRDQGGSPHSEIEARKNWTLFCRLPRAEDRPELPPGNNGPRGRIPSKRKSAKRPFIGRPLDASAMGCPAFGQWRPMKGATGLGTLRKRGICSSFWRPSVCNDNAYSESLSKTMKYRPNYPVDRSFNTHDEARQSMATFVQWENVHHRHGASRLMRQSPRHRGENRNLRQHRTQVHQAVQLRASRGMVWKHQKQGEPH